MKKQPAFFILLYSIIVALIACNSAEPPKEIAQKFINALKKKDIALAQSYSTSETKARLEDFKVDTSLVVSNEVEFLGEVSEDESVAKYRYSIKGIDDEHILVLEKTEEKWLVSINKAQIGLFFTEPPIVVARKFINLLEDKKYKEAQFYATEDTKRVVSLIEGFANLSATPKEKKEYAFIEEKIIGSKASVTYKEKGSDEIQTIFLYKEGKTWKISMSKEDYTFDKNRNIRE